MRRIADRIKGAQFVVFPNAGHSVWWEAPDKFNRTVLTFVAIALRDRVRRLDIAGEEKVPTAFDR